jgi:hypothetical protein
VPEISISRDRDLPFKSHEHPRPHVYTCYMWLEIKVSFGAAIYSIKSSAADILFNSRSQTSQKSSSNKHSSSNKYSSKSSSKSQTASSSTSSSTNKPSLKQKYTPSEPLLYYLDDPTHTNSGYSPTSTNALTQTSRFPDDRTMKIELGYGIILESRARAQGNIDWFDRRMG